MFVFHSSLLSFDSHRLMVSYITIPHDVSNRISHNDILTLLHHTACSTMSTWLQLLEFPALCPGEILCQETDTEHCILKGNLNYLKSGLILTFCSSLSLECLCLLMGWTVLKFGSVF